VASRIHAKHAIAAGLHGQVNPFAEILVLADLAATMFRDENRVETKS